MLNKAERHQVLKVFRLFSIIGLLPIKIDVSNWKLTAPSKVYKWFCHANLSIFMLHAIYKAINLMYAILFVPTVELRQLVLHAISVMVSQMCIFWYYELYICNPTLLAAYAEMTLVGNIGGSLGRKDTLRRRWKARLREYSMQDLIATSLPHMVALVIPLTAASYIYDPSMRLLLYAALPSPVQNWATFGLCLLEEIRFMVILLTVTVPILQLHVTSFDLVSNQLQHLKRTINWGTQSTRRIVRFFRSLQLYICILNSVNYYLIFTWKLVSISFSVLSGYAAIAHFSDHPVFGVMYYVMYINVTLIYTVSYEKAFKIPQLLDRAAACVLLRSRKYQTKVFRRQIMSVPPIGVKIGNFHKMERESTLIFMDLKMLVAYN